MNEQQKRQKLEALERCLHFRSNFSIMKSNAKNIISRILDQNHNSPQIEAVMVSSNFITDPKEVKEAVKTYFFGLFDKNSSTQSGELAQIHAASEFLLPITDEISISELQIVLNGMGKGKAPGL